MIQLRSDCLEFEMSTGETFPCSAETVTVELIGKAVESIDPEIVRHAAEAVLHYFKEELGRQHVTIDEFSNALEKVLKRMGFSVDADEETSPAAAGSVIQTDLGRLAFESGKGYELMFFSRLDTLRFCFFKQFIYDGSSGQVLSRPIIDHLHSVA